MPRFLRLENLHRNERERLSARHSATTTELGSTDMALDYPDVVYVLHIGAVWHDRFYTSHGAQDARVEQWTRLYWRKKTRPGALRIQVKA